MKIQRPPKELAATSPAATDEQALRFINEAPDGQGKATSQPKAKAHGGRVKGNKVQFTHTMSPGLLEDCYEMAKKLEYNRTTFINTCVKHCIENGITFGSRKELE